jgi:hypothetical protein
MLQLLDELLQYYLKHIMGWFRKIWSEFDEYQLPKALLKQCK